MFLFLLKRVNDVNQPFLLAPLMKKSSIFVRQNMNPILNIIAGCNGAGKTTASFAVLPDLLNCKEFVNADEIARGLSPFRPEKVAVEAGRLMLERIEELLKGKENFAIETTLSTRSYKNKVLNAQENGYKVSLMFFWLENPELAVERVKTRVEEGGHNIPEDVILRRYWKGIKNLFEIYIPIVDEWAVFDSSIKDHKLIAQNVKNGEIEIKDLVKWEKIKEMSYGKQ
jgi:predicted ABC-type ATPase